MATTYLYKNQGTATNAKKFTYSVWLKRSKIANDDGSTTQRFYQGYETSNNRFYALFNDEDKLWIYAVTGGTIELYWVSNRRFTDTNFWYHIVFSGDTTQAAQADRFKVYVNGVEETSWTKNNNISQNVDWGNLIAHTANDLTISGTESQGQMFDGLMSHIHFIDGTAYDASAFGETDANGKWKIKTAPSVTYGDTGYFILKDDNSNLDRSGNNNHFTIGGTLTKTSDCPSNVFATWNALQPDGASLSYGNTRGANNAGGSIKFISGISSLGMPINTGIYYCEVKLESESSSGESLIGVGGDVERLDLSAQTENGTGWFGIRNDSGTKYANTTQTNSTHDNFSAGQIIGMAMDTTNKKLTFSRNGGWWAGTNDFTGTSPDFTTHYIDCSGGNYETFYFYAAASNGASVTSTWSANFGNGYFSGTAVSSAGTNATGQTGIFEYDMPSSSKVLSTKGLNS